MKLEFKKVTTEEILKETYKLRYKVYCEEWGFEKPVDYPGGLEFDEFDNHSVHFVAEKDGLIIGTVRIILNSEKGFPIKRHCKIDVDLSHLKKDKIGEISRLAISKEYRRRAEDRFLYEGIPEVCTDTPQVYIERRRRLEIIVGLYKCIYIESKNLDLTCWYAVMAKGLYQLLKKMGIFFVPVGPEIYYHGFRTPYLGCIEDMEAEISKANPELFKEFREDLLQLKSFYRV